MLYIFWNWNALDLAFIWTKNMTLKKAVNSPLKYLTACISVLILQLNNTSNAWPPFKLLSIITAVNYLRLYCLKANTAIIERKHRIRALFYKKERLEQSLLAWSLYFPTDLGLIPTGWTVIHYTEDIGRKKSSWSDKWDGKNVVLWLAQNNL